jgi:uncharacterized membrane protein YedE/YeeE
MMGPLYKFGLFGDLYSLQLALLLGFCFGFVLERAGFGNPRKLVAVFYLRDFAVLKVMFTAIIVCMLGLLYFSVFGWIDLGNVYLLPTYIWPQIVGGLLLGVGFVMGGYCPTTSVVATVSGKLDGLIFLVGMVAGSVLFAELFPLLEGFYNSGDLGSLRLSGVLGIGSGTIAILACLFASAAFWVAERVEKRFGDPEVLPAPAPKRKTIAVLLLLAGGLILAVIGPDRIAAQRPAPQTGTPAVEKSKEAEEKKAKEAPEFKIVDDEGC